MRRSCSLRDMLSLIEFLWKKVYLVFLIFSDNVFAVNHPPSFSSSSFTVEKCFDIVMQVKKICVVGKHFRI